MMCRFFDKWCSYGFGNLLQHFMGLATCDERMEMAHGTFDLYVPSVLPLMFAHVEKVRS